MILTIISDTHNNHKKVTGDLPGGAYEGLLPWYTVNGYQ